MSPHDRLYDAYREWRRLAEEEGEAIRENNWPGVQSCQDSLHELQPQIIRWTQQARNEWLSLGRDITVEENRLRGVIGELIEIERRNSAWLNDLQQAAQLQLNELQQTGHTLRQVQRSYAPSRPAAWSSFS